MDRFCVMVFVMMFVMAFVMLFIVLYQDLVRGGLRYQDLWVRSCMRESYTKIWCEGLVCGVV